MYLATGTGLKQATSANDILWQISLSADILHHIQLVIMSHEGLVSSDTMNMSGRSY